MYKPKMGERCLISPPNCDGPDGDEYFEFNILWTDEKFVLYGNEGCWPNLNKWEHIKFKELVHG
ncbi:MAG: hypothetical protein SVO01_00635 [Thermotogota bacterium]|nr:hypothetical protein [Thermotogota bacterium]